MCLNLRGCKKPAYPHLGFVFLTEIVFVVVSKSLSFSQIALFLSVAHIYLRTFATILTRPVQRHNLNWQNMSNSFVKCEQFFFRSILSFVSTTNNTAQKGSQHASIQDWHIFSSYGALWLPFRQGHKYSSTTQPNFTRRHTRKRRSWGTEWLAFCRLSGASLCLFPSLWVKRACAWLKYSMSSHSPQLGGKKLYLWQPHCKLLWGLRQICVQFEQHCRGTVDHIHWDTWLSKTLV